MKNFYFLSLVVLLSGFCAVSAMDSSSEDISDLRIAIDDFKSQVHGPFNAHQKIWYSHLYSWASAQDVKSARDLSRFKNTIDHQAVQAHFVNGAKRQLTFHDSYTSSSSSE